MEQPLPTPRRKPPLAHTRLLLAGVLVAVCLIGAAAFLLIKASPPAVGDAAADATATSEVHRGDGKSDPAPVSPSSTQAPDVLPNPNIAPGTCAFVTYTPQSAKQKQSGELCRPKDAQRDVAVILVHGGAGVGGTYSGMKPWANRLNTEGYVTFAIDYHLFTEGSSGPVFPWPEQNIKASVQYLRGTANALGIKANRIAVEGFSAGARLGAVAYTTPNDQYFLGPELYPYISDEVNAYIGYYHPLDGSMQFQHQYYGGDDSSSNPKVQERWLLADALANAGRAKGPALLVTGDNDWDIQITQNELMVERLQDAGLEAAWLVVPKGGHGFDQGDGRRLSKLGEQSATGVLTFLNDSFPQTPARGAQEHPADVVNAPNSTGVPPTSYVPLPRATSTTVKRSSGARPTTTVRPPVTAPATAPTTVITTVPTSPPSTSPPSTSPPTSPPTSAPPTTNSTPKG
jgi:acetyl esterase/lipase